MREVNNESWTENTKEEKDETWGWKTVRSRANEIQKGNRKRKLMKGELDRIKLRNKSEIDENRKDFSESKGKECGV